MVKALWTNLRFFWAYLSSIKVIMIELEAKINFTSLNTINETFFKKIIACTLLKTNLPIPYEKRKKISKGRNNVPSIVRSFYICFTKPCTCTTTTTIHVTTCHTSQVTNFTMESHSMYIKWAWKAKISTISTFNEHEDYHYVHIWTLHQNYT